MGFFAVLAASLFFVFLFTVFGGYSLLLWCQQSLWMIVPPALVLAVLSASVIRRRWFTGLMVLSTLLICYSRIYLGKHYPMDLVWGTAVGIALGLAAFWAYRRLSRQKKELQ